MINYNNKNLTAQAAQSILDCSPQLGFEIIVVDNSSDPAQVYEDNRRNIRVISHVENKGFGHACNIGTQLARGKYILYLNNDTLMHKGTLETCVDYLEKHPGVGAVGTRTLLQDGTLDHACKRGFPTPMASLYYFCGLDKLFPNNKKYGVYRQTFVPEESISEVDSLAGSFLLLPRWVFDQIGGYDERFFMYGEDLDLCYRIKALNLSVIYFGKATITHLKGQSGLHTKSEEVIFHFYNAMDLFYNKHYRQRYGWLTSLLVAASIKAKYALTLLKMKLEKT